MFQYVGSTDVASSGRGEIRNSSLDGTGVTGQYRYMAARGIGLETILRGKFLKTTEVSTVRFHAYMWVASGGGFVTAYGQSSQ